jgi:RHS repeat-associated protein
VRATYEATPDQVEHQRGAGPRAKAAPAPLDNPTAPAPAPLSWLAPAPLVVATPLPQGQGEPQARPKGGVPALPALNLAALLLPPRAPRPVPGGRGTTDTTSAQARDFGAPPPPAARLVLLFTPTGGGQTVRREVWLSATAATEWEELAVGLQLPATGSVRGYVEHLSGQKVVFDDILLEIGTPETAIIVQEEHYYGFGLGMAGLDYNAPGNAEHRFKFNGGVERTVDFGLSWDESGARNYDPQLGRFLAVDPLADQENQEGWTPYHFVSDNPVGANDPNGTCEGCGTNPKAWLLEGFYQIFAAVGSLFDGVKGGSHVTTSMTHKTEFGNTEVSNSTIVENKTEASTNFVNYLHAKKHGGTDEVVKVENSTDLKVENALTVKGTVRRIPVEVSEKTETSTRNKTETRSVNVTAKLEAETKRAKVEAGAELSMSTTRQTANGQKQTGVSAKVFLDFTTKKPVLQTNTSPVKSEVTVKTGFFASFERLFSN